MTQPEIFPPHNQPEVLTPADFGQEALKTFAIVYPLAQKEERFGSEDVSILTATRNAEMHFSAGRREEGWNELEGRLGAAGWGDNERKLSFMLTAAEVDCGLEEPLDQSESFELTLDFLDKSASDETKVLLDSFSGLPDGQEKVDVLETLLVKVEAAIGGAVADNKSQALRKRLRSAQQSLFIEKGVMQESYPVRSSQPEPVKYEVYPPAPERVMRGRTRRR